VDPLGHVGRFLAVDPPVLELDRRVFALPGESLQLVTPAGPQRAGDRAPYFGHRFVVVGVRGVKALCQAR